jgi:hypothetical protein
MIGGVGEAMGKEEGVFEWPHLPANPILGFPEVVVWNASNVGTVANSTPTASALTCALVKRGIVV